MIQNVSQLRVTMQQMERLIHAIDDLRANVLPQNPALFAALAESPLDHLDRLRQEISEYVHELEPSA